MTRETAFFEGWSRFKFNNLRLALGTNLKFNTSVAKGLKLKVRKFWELIPTFVEITGEKLVGGPFCTPTPSIGLIPLINSSSNGFCEFEHKYLKQDRPQYIITSCVYVRNCYRDIFLFSNKFLLANYTRSSE